MAKVPSPLEKREWIYGERGTQAEVHNLAQHFIDEQRYSDAIDCLNRFPDQEKLKAILKNTIKEGDFFIANRLLSFLEISDKEWENLAKNAEEQGKWLFAMSAFQKLGNEEKAAAIKEKFKKSSEGKYIERL